MRSNQFYAAFDLETWGNRRALPDDSRSPFQVDRDRIVFSEAFRQLQSKTQVFQTGAYDFYRTRLTHTIEVARIARSIAEFLNHRSPELGPDFFLDPDLVEAVGLGHDLGHPPFGHIGERTLHHLMASHGGFEGNAQSLRLLTHLMFPRREGSVGISPTRALLDGVLKYPALHRELATATSTPQHHFLYDDQEPVRAFIFGPAPADAPPPRGIECQIMDWADDTAYSLHDVVDGIRARFLTEEAIERWGSDQGSRLSPAQADTLTELCRSIRDQDFDIRSSQHIGTHIRACSLRRRDLSTPPPTWRHAFELVVDEQVAGTCRLYKKLAVDLIFRSPTLQQVEFRARHLLSRLFEALSDLYLHPAAPSLRVLPTPIDRRLVTTAPEERPRLLCDFLASLTDGQAIRLYRHLFEPEFSSISDLA